MLEKILSVVGGFGDPRVGGADSFCDRLNCKYTSFIILLFAGFVTARMYLAESIVCWAPTHFTKSQRDFAKDACWVKNTYRLPFDRRMPRPTDDRDHISYYQWIGLVLCAQGLFFYLPRPVWAVFSKRSGIAVSTITDAAIETQQKRDPDERQDTIMYMTNHLARFLKLGAVRPWYSCFHGSYLVLWYLFVKLLYVLNAVGQLLFVMQFLGNTDFFFHGLAVIKRLFEGKTFFGFTDRFPRVTFCDFQVRVLGNVQNYTVQCTLYVNMYNEAIYTFLWLWFVVVGTASSMSLLVWSVKSLTTRGQMRFVAKRLIAFKRFNPAAEDADKILKEFVQLFLRKDGILVLRLVINNTSDIIATQVLCGVWDYYKINREKLMKLTELDQALVIQPDEMLEIK